MTRYYPLNIFTYLFSSHCVHPDKEQSR